MKRFADKNVAAVSKAYPSALRSRLMELRGMVFDVAGATDGVGLSVCRCARCATASASR
jgi:hypothetical protein